MDGSDRQGGTHTVARAAAAGGNTGSTYTFAGAGAASAAATGTTDTLTRAIAASCSRAVSHTKAQQPLLRTIRFRSDPHFGCGCGGRDCCFSIGIFALKDYAKVGIDVLDRSERFVCEAEGRGDPPRAHTAFRRVTTLALPLRGLYSCGSLVGAWWRLLGPDDGGC